jgi:oligopeptide/dipeptide ABC transporter ATP-binding protein
VRRQALKAVDGVSFVIRRGETFGLVGESGCGKSTLSRLVLRLEEVSGGSISFEGKDLAALGRREMLSVRRQMQIVFQDPYDSINPRMTVRQVVTEPMAVHRFDKAGWRPLADKLLADVGLSKDLADRLPHQLSGGQRQRLCIARALALSPKLLVCDEAVSALDVSIQAQILNLMLDLKEEHGLTYLFISHNLSVVKYISDRIGVMYFGKLVEVAGKEELFANCLHPYTGALFSAIPTAHPDAHRERMILKGDVPNLYEPPMGCIFSDRCPFVRAKCRDVAPEMRSFGEGHEVACHFAGELDIPRGWEGAL